MRAPHFRGSSSATRSQRSRLRKPPLGESPRREFHGGLHEADAFEDLPWRWQAALLPARQNRHRLRLVGDD
jgi:hypothetical protein